MENSSEENGFPVWGLLPKKETGVTSFLNANPNFNGTGVTIAIFDSGVDPGAPGLSSTPDGKVKVIERFDCSGCSDVSMKTIVRPKEGIIVGLSGRKLTIPDSWNNASNTYRVGIKNCFDMFPDKLKQRIHDETKKKQWDHQHTLAVGAAMRECNAFEAAHNSAAPLSDEDKLTKENLDAMVEHLTMADKKYADLGTYYDCVMFHDGDKWMACVDTSECGDLAQCTLLGEYSITHDFAPLTAADQINFSINVHDNGDVLELVSVCSSHGTHVSSIASAYFPDDPERNGVAPGAQIVSLTIGDGRLGSMETGTGLVRAMIKVIELKDKLNIRVINMSYGELAHWSNSGRIGQLINEIVDKYGIVWIGSGGNHGPALSTIGTPPDISQETVIGVGAYVSPDMMEAEYAMRVKLPGMMYTWSSRGPTMDGGLGISVCAPGGAITSVPNFTLRNSQLFNGSSMAAPHVSGVVAILLSGLLQSNIKYSPYSMKRALENGATSLKDVESFAQGCGLVNVERSFDLLCKNGEESDCDVRYLVQCGPNKGKGIYIRCKGVKSTLETQVSVEPQFLDSDNVPASKKIDFNVKLVLSCDVEYVEYPKYLDLSNCSRMFAIKIDMRGLTGIHHTCIEVHDAFCIEKGVLFKVPITIIIPDEIQSPANEFVVERTHFGANTIQRSFIKVPEYATWAVLKMRSFETEVVGKFILHTMQLLPRKSCRSKEVNKSIAVHPAVEAGISFPVIGNLTLEVAVAKFWAQIDSIDVAYTITFYGVKPLVRDICMNAADGVYKMDVTCLQAEEIAPMITLKNAVQVLKPSESKIISLSARDIIPPGRQIYEMQLTYNFHLNKAAEVAPDCPLVSNTLYESEYESQLWMIYDSNKQYMGCGDAYPSKYSIKLDKGDFTIKMHVRHEKKDMLEKLADAAMHLSQKMNTTLSMDVHASHSHAMLGKKSSFAHVPPCSACIPLYIAPLAADKYSSKNNNVAHYLCGIITYAKDDVGKRTDTYPFRYYLNEAAKKSSKGSEKLKSKSEEFKDAVRDLKLSWLSKLDTPTEVEALFDEMIKDYPDHLPIYTSYLQNIEGMDSKRQLPLLSKDDLQAQNEEVIKKIMHVCDKALDNIYNNSILMYFTVTKDQKCDSTQVKQFTERKKNVYIDSLIRNGIANCRLHLMDPSDPNRLDMIATIWISLQQFVDPNDVKSASSNVMFFACWHAAIFKHYGRLLKYMQRIMDEKPCREIEDKMIEIYKLQKWSHMVRNRERLSLVKYPQNYRPF